jgi:hypothetical protein
MFGAIVLVSRAQPGLLAAPREDLAATDALLAAPAPLRELLLAGGLPAVPPGDPAAVEAAVLTALRDCASLLRRRDPALLATFRATVLDAVGRTASALHGVSVREQDEIGRIRQALDDS